MINSVYQLVSPRLFSIKYEEQEFQNKAIIKPSYMAICHADQRYYLGLREQRTLEQKLPMALIHEFCGHILYDPSGQFTLGELVTVIPNMPTVEDDIIFENYRKGSYFLSSGYDGFMREYVDAEPERVVSLKGIPENVGAITEFISVAVHAVNRWSNIAHAHRDKIGIWGDGSLAYVVANIIKIKYPDIYVAVIGRNMDKLSYFSFVDTTYVSDNIPGDFQIDHAFECCGGEGSYYAIEDITTYINPQGTIMLMGVSENRVAINTRRILEKGLTVVGCSRSGYEDFVFAKQCLQNKKFQRRISQIIYEDAPVNGIEDIHRVFRMDNNTPFKTVFKWNI